MTAVVFVGPSLGGEPAPAMEGVELLGPAMAGDLYLAARRGATVIGLVDGVFEDRPTVWHKEILWALDRGVSVIGAASLGALRAVECGPFGMEGVGYVFERCRDGDLEDDHELAVAYAPAELSHKPLNEALINVRATVEAAVVAGIVRKRAADALVERAAAMPFRELTWSRLLAEARDLRWSKSQCARFSAWLPGGRVDVKRADALRLLEAVAAAAAGSHVPPPAFQFAETRYWRQAVEWFERRGLRFSEADEGVLDELRLDPLRFESKMIRAFARRAARQAPVDEIDGEELLEDFRLQFGLVSAADFKAWTRSVRSDRDAIAAALVDEERLQLALEEAIPELAEAVLNDLRVNGRFEHYAHRAADKRRRLAERSDPPYREAELHRLIDEICVAQRMSIASNDLDLLARSLGLEDRRALHQLLRREYDYVRMNKARDDLR